MAVPVNPEEYRQLAAGPSAIAKYAGARDQTYMPIAQQVIQERLRGRRPQDLSRDLAMLERQRLQYMQQQGGLSPSDIARAHTVAGRGAPKPAKPLSDAEKEIVEAGVRRVYGAMTSDLEPGEVSAQVGKALDLVAGVSNSTLRHRLNDYLWKRFGEEGITKAMVGEGSTFAKGAGKSTNLLEAAIDHSMATGKLPSRGWDPQYAGLDAQQAQQVGAPGASYEDIIAAMKGAAKGGPEQLVLDQFEAEKQRLMGQHGKPTYGGRLIAPIEQVDTSGFDALLRGPSSAPPAPALAPPVGGGGVAAGAGPSVSPSVLDLDPLMGTEGDITAVPPGAVIEAPTDLQPIQDAATAQLQARLRDPTAAAFQAGTLDMDARMGPEAGVITATPPRLPGTLDMDLLMGPEAGVITAQPQVDLSRFERSGTAEREGLSNVVPELVRPAMAQTAEEVAALEALYGDIPVTSGYRSPEVNIAVGGAERSRHMEGLAADMLPPGGMSMDEWAAILRERNPGAEVIPYPDKGHVHLGRARGEP